MPQAAGAAAASYFVAGSVSASIAYGVAYVVTSVAISVGMSYAMQAMLAPSTRSPQQATTPQSGRLLNIRQPVAAWRYVYGQVRVGGVTTEEIPTSDFNYIYNVITSAAHASSEVGSVYMNESLIPFSINPDGSFTATTPTDPDPSVVNWKNRLIVWRGDGTSGGDALLLQALSTVLPERWTATSKQSGHTKMFSSLQFEPSLSAGGFPQINIVVKGKLVWDFRSPGPIITTAALGAPGIWTTATAHSLVAGDQVNISGCTALGGRDGGLIDGSYIIGTVPTSSEFTLIDCAFPVAVTSAGVGGTVTKLIWSSNPMLCVYDFLADRFIGFHMISSEFNFIEGTAGANVCDEYVALSSNSEICTVDVSTDTITLANPVLWPTGTQIYITTSGTLPSGVSTGVPVFVINPTADGVSSTTTIRLSDTQGDAVLQYVLSLGTSGSGTLTATRGCAVTASTATGTLTSLYSSVSPVSGLDRVYTTPKLSYKIGDKVRCISTGTLPSGYSAGTDYYWVYKDHQNGALASSVTNACSGIVIVPSDVGVGNMIVYVTEEQRYTLNGVIDSSLPSATILTQMLSAMAGKICSTGQITVFAGYYRTPTVPAITRDVIISSIKTKTLVSGRDIVNCIKCTFIDPVNNWQPNSCVPRISEYVAVDGGRRVWTSIDLPFTISDTTAQRIIKILLETTRRERSIQFQTNLNLFTSRVGDIIPITDDRYGLYNSPYEILDWVFGADSSGGGPPIYSIGLTLRETDAAVYAWSASEEIQPPISLQKSTQPDISFVTPPSNVTLTMGA